MTNKQLELGKKTRNEILNEVSERIDTIDNSIMQGEFLEHVRKYDENGRIVYEYLEGDCEQWFGYNQNGKLEFEYRREYGEITASVIYYDREGKIDAWLIV